MGIIPSFSGKTTSGGNERNIFGGTEHNQDLRGSHFANASVKYKPTLGEVWIVPGLNERFREVWVVPGLS